MHASPSKPLEVAVPLPVRGCKLASELPDLAVQVAGVDGHFDALVLALGQLRAQFRELDRHLEDGDLWRRNGDLHRLCAGGRPERRPGFGAAP